MLNVYPILCHNPTYWYNPVTWLYGAIRWWEKSFWNHGVICVDIYGMKYIVDAQAKIRIRPYEKWLAESSDRTWAICHIPTNLLNQQIVTKTLQTTSAWYDLSVYPNYITNRLFGFKIFPEGGKTTYYCFELIKYVYSLNEYDLITGKDLEKYILNINQPK